MDQFSIVTAPSPRQRLEESNLSTIGVITKLGARYIISDVTPEHFSKLMQQIDLRSEQIAICNISEAVLLLPYRIIASIVRIIDISGMEYETLWTVPIEA